MTDESLLAEEPEDDPEVAALLSFTPVPRKCDRSDGWSADVQRRYIAALASMGTPARAAPAVGRTESGAWTVRRAAGAESFSAAWDKAVALYYLRNPRPERRGRPPRGLQDAFAPDSDFEADDPETDEQLKLEVFDRIIHRYIRMLDRERIARLEGRIVEADFYVRQLFFVEVVLDLGGQAQRLLQALGPGERLVTEVVATPVSVYLDGIRRRYWSLQDEPERPPLPELGEHDDKIALGPCRAYMPARDGPDIKAWEQRREAEYELAAAAQEAWEEKARHDAEAWRRRVEGKDQA
jgi:hypothetical protein